jgi:hypothetical protein
MMTDIPIITVDEESGTLLVDGVPFDPEIHDVGWQVLDPEGNVVDSGPIVVAEMSGDLAEQFGLDQGE